jgi:hypothetical protein
MSITSSEFEEADEEDACGEEDAGGEEEGVLSG